MIVKRLIAGLAGLGAVALLVSPARAITPVAPGGDIEAGWTWTVAGPAEYNTGPHEVSVGISDVTRTVTISKAAGPGGPEAGDTWQVFNGYFSAEGTFTAAEALAGQDSDSVSFEDPESNTVAGQELGVRLRVSDPDTAGWEVDKSSSVAPLVLLRKTDFISGSTRNKVNASPEPYTCGDPIVASGKLLRANWSHDRYDSYAGRNVHIQARTDGGVQPAYVDEAEKLTNSNGNVTVALNTGTPGAALTCEAKWIIRGLYYGNGTSSGNWSTGDAVALAS